MYLSCSDTTRGGWERRMMELWSKESMVKKHNKHDMMILVYAHKLDKCLMKISRTSILRSQIYVRSYLKRMSCSKILRQHFCSSKVS